MQGYRKMDDSFRIIETFGWHPGEGARRIDRHLARMARTAEMLGITFAVEGALTLISDIANETPQRCRLTLDRAGEFDLTTAPLGEAPPEWRIAIAPDRLHSSDRWLGMKTTNRAIYDQARATLPDGVDELIFVNERGHLCEGTITNLFADLGDGLVTPPLSDGLLPGILREEMLDGRKAQEATLIPADLTRTQRLYVGNSLRGLIPATLIST